jgi:ribosome-binding protein aMBF1 (putative translation factor)
MDMRVQLLRDWMAREERGTVWVAKKVGRTKAYISNILHGHLPLTEKLARDLQAKLGIPLLVDAQVAQRDDTKPGRSKHHKRCLHGQEHGTAPEH